MDVFFKDSKLRELCETERSAKRQLGADGARKLRSRLADLRAATSVAKLPAGRPHPLTGDRVGQFAVDLAGGRRLVFEPANEPTPKKESGGIDWTAVTKVRIVFIGDYHD